MLQQKNESATSQDVVKVIETTNQGVRSINLSRVAIGYVLRGRKVLYHNDRGIEINEGEMFILGLGVHYEENVALTETFEQIHNSGTATMIIISHQERIISLADEVIVVGDGNIRHRGSAQEILPQILADTLGGCPVLTKEVKA
jgi:hypothetical protein